MLEQLTPEEQAYAAKNGWPTVAKRSSFAARATRRQIKGSFSAGHPPRTALRAQALALQKAPVLPQSAQKHPSAYVSIRQQALQKASVLPQSAQKLSQVSFDNRGALADADVC